MIDKVQYGDFNRFLVSTGYLLVAVGLIIPYFYLRGNFDLQLESEKIQLLTATARQVVNKRQEFSLKLIQIIPWASIGLVVVGIIFLLIGGRRWWKKQLIEDEKLKEEVSKIKNENKKATLEFEKSLNAEKVSEEETIQHKELEVRKEDSSMNAKETKLLAQTYFAVETVIAEKFKQAYSDRFNIFTNYRINDIEFDIILSGINVNTSSLDISKDIIVEIKYTSKHITSTYVLETLSRVALLLKKYPREVSRPVVFFITADYNRINEADIRQAITEEWSSKTISKWNIFFLNLKELPGFNLKDKIMI